LFHEAAFVFKTVRRSTLRVSARHQPGTCYSGGNGIPIPTHKTSPEWQFFVQLLDFKPVAMYQFTPGFMQNGLNNTNAVTEEV
jgi:hypothetical protein